MAVGKTVAGRRLARRLKRSFMDLDQVIEEREGMKVEKIFNRKGESYFRKLEKQTLKEILARDDQVIATGGGVVLDTGSRSLLNRRSVVICLKARPQTLLRRSGPNSERPLLQGENRLQRIQELLAQREGFYDQAHIRIDTENLSVEEVVEMIMKELPVPPIPLSPLSKQKGGR